MAAPVFASDVTAASQRTALRPYFLCRVSGLPIESVESLRAPETAALCGELATIDATLHRQRDALTARLFEAIGRVTDKPVRNRLMQLRRDLFNLRAPRPADVEATDRLLDEDLRASIAECCALLAARGALEVRVAAAYERELSAARRRFQAALADEDFRRGLLVSSPTLSMNLPKYRGAAVDRFGAREEQIERGLLRYFTRTAMKSTPFGSLCAVLPGAMDDDSDDVELRSAFRLVGDPRTKRAFVRLNKSLFGVLWSHLKRRPAVRDALVIDLTPTLSRADGVFQFLTAIDGRELFQTLAANEVLEAVVQILRAHQGTTFGAVVEHVCRDPEIDASPEEASAFLDQLRALGLLRFRSGIADQDADWDIPFAAMLDPIDDPHARAAADLLRTLRAHLTSYGEASTSERERIAAEIRDKMAATFSALEIGGRVRGDLPFYEDATAAAECRLSRTPAVFETFERLTELAELIMPLAIPRAEQAAMRHFFDTKYGDTTPAVPLLRFYEDYYREHFKAHLEKEMTLRSPGGRAAIGDYDVANPFKLDVVARSHAAANRLMTLARTRWAENPAAVEITLTHDEFAAAFENVPPLPARPRSIAMFCQLDVTAAPVAGRPAARLVLPNATLFTGRGKYFSRFLYMLPPSLHELVVADNVADDDELRAEICADGDFNANLHPRLLDWEISYPTAESGLAEGQLLSADLDVARAKDDPHSLRLIHRATHRTVVPHDLGFLNPRARPPLFQLLSRFTPLNVCSLMFPESLAPPPRAATPANEPASAAPAPAAPASGAAPAIVCRPRITYHSVIVLARRRWTIPFETFPRRNPAESDSAYFVRLSQWRVEHGIPAQSYMRVQPQPVAAPQPSAKPAAAQPPTQAEEPLDTGDEEGLDDEHDGESQSAEEAAPPPAAESPAAESPAAESPAAKSAARAARPRHSRDWIKPQFMDFESPLLVKLFGQLPNALPRFTVVLEERLPNVEGLAEAGDDRYASELVLQFDFDAAGDAADV